MGIYSFRKKFHFIRLFNFLLLEWLDTSKVYISLIILISEYLERYIGP